MDPRLLTLLREQHANHFRDVAGANATVTLPLSDRLVTRLIADSLPRSAPVREIDLRAHRDNQFVIRLRLMRPAFLPSIAITSVIEQQPRLPDSPLIVFRLSLAGGLMGAASMAARFFDLLPPGIVLDRDRVLVDLRVLLERCGASDVLDYLEHLQLTTEEGRFVIDVRAALPSHPAP